MQGVNDSPHPKSEVSAPASSRAVPIVWSGLDDEPLTFANAMMVQNTPHEFVVTFGQIAPPVVFNSSQIADIESVRARTVIRIALPPSRVQELIEVLSTNYEKYRKRLSSDEAEMSESDA